MPVADVYVAAHDAGFEKLVDQEILDFDLA